MNEIKEQTLNSTSLLVSDNNNVSNSSLICCFSKKWCFDHMVPATYENYNESHVIYCRCLNCCNWCLLFEPNECIFCKKNVVCFLCCFTIAFT